MRRFKRFFKPRFRQFKSHRRVRRVAPRFSRGGYRI